MKRIRTIVWTVAVAVALGGAARAEVELSPVFFFSNTNGKSPYGRLLQAADGNLYGTTYQGGAAGFGTLFELTTNGVLTTLASFRNTNGAFPYAGLVQASDGNFYGTASAGGSKGYGTVFQFGTNGVLTTLVSFAGTNGATPCGGLVEGSDGCLYGTTREGGAKSLGTLFKVTTDGLLTTLLSFAGTNGSKPYAGLVLGSDGNFYGTTAEGGTNTKGTVFQLAADGTLTTLLSLSAATGYTPSAGLVAGWDGNLYGLASAGGARGCGTAYQITTGGVATVLYSFTNVVGTWPSAALVQAADGFLYGTTLFGGSGQPAGQVFQLSTNGEFTPLANLGGEIGGSASGGLLEGAAGTFYGVTTAGAYNGNGTVFRLRVPQSAPSISLQPQSQMSLAGSNVTLSVSADGHLPLSFQWFKDGAALAGATNATCTLRNLQAEAAGLYTVAVSNCLGGVLSSNAVLSVGPLAIMRQPQPAIVARGYDTSFSLLAAGAAPMAYQWRKDGQELPCATNSSLTLTNTQDSDAAGYCVVVSNADGCVTSAVAALRVVSPYTFGTWAGSVERGRGNVDGPSNLAQFYSPTRMVFDPAGNLYVSDFFAHTIRKVTPEGMVSTLAGLAGVRGTNDGPGSLARFSHPEGLALDAATNLYVADNGNYTIRKLTPGGVVTTIAGVPGRAGAGDGPVNVATFGAPSDLAIDGAGNIYVSDWEYGLIRKIMPNGMVITLAGAPPGGTIVDGVGSAAGFGAPAGIALDKDGNLYVADQVSPYPPVGALRKVTPGGKVTTLTSQLCPYSVVLDGSGNCYVGTYAGETVSQVTPEGLVTTLAGMPGVAGFADGPGSAARFNGTRLGLAWDAGGNLYAADHGQGLIRKGVRFPLAAAPQSQAALAGTPVTLGAALTEPTGYSFQWLSNGVALPGETNLTLDLGLVGRSNSGWYTLDLRDANGNSVQLNALVRALLPPLLQPPLLLTNQSFRLSFQDCDGGLPYDLAQVQLQWRTNVTDTNWQTALGRFAATNGWATMDDTNAPGAPSRFYRILER